MIEHTRRLFDYNDWANREVTNSLKAGPEPPATSVSILGHIVAAEWLWIGRLKHDQTAVIVWPQLALDQCEVQFSDLARLWREYLNELTIDKLIETVSYRTGAGEEFTNNVGDILSHVIMHGVYHRGQIARDMRVAGLEPPFTDYIHAVRNGLI